MHSTVKNLLDIQDTIKVKLNEININNYPIAIEGEGGHSSFAPNSDVEIELLQFLRKKYNYSVNKDLLYTLIK